MANDIDPQILRDLANSIKSLSKMDMFPRTQDDKNFDAIVQKLDDLEKGNAKNTKRLVDNYDKAFKTAGLTKEIKSLRDVMQAQDQYKAMKNIVSHLTDKEQLTFKNKEDVDRAMLHLQRQAESAGMSLEDMGISATTFFNTSIGKWELRVKDHDKAVENLTRDTNKLGVALDEAADETERYTKRVEFAKNMLGKFGNVAKTIGKDFIRLAEQEQRFAQQNAVADAGWIDGVMRMQISTLDYMKILKDTRRESLAMAAAGISFKDSLVAGQDSLEGLTASSTEAAMVSKEFHKNMSRIGVSQDDLGDAVTQQTKLYKEHYRVLGYSAEEFANLTKELINDQGMRSVLLGLQEKERKAYIMGVQQRVAEYQTMGFTIQRAKELQKTFQSLNAMNPKERMKQAAKTRAMMGAMGMGAEGAELFDLQTQYRTMDADQKKAADLRMTQIQSRAADKFGAMSGSGAGQGQSFAMQMMADKTGFGKIAETFETASGEGLKVSSDQLIELKKAAASQNEISQGSQKLLKGLDTWQAASNTALTSIGTNLISGFGNLAMINITGFTAAAMGGLGGDVDSRPNRAGKGPKSKNKGKQGKAGKVAKAGKFAKIGKIISKTGIGSVLKKIPGLSILAGVGYGLNRLMDGDVLGAGMELASGVMGTIPGLGTAGSIGMDAALAARDISKAANMKPDEPELPVEETPKPSNETKKITTADQLLATLQSIDMYLRETGALNDANAKSMNKLGESIEDTSKRAALPGRPA